MKSAFESDEEKKDFEQPTSTVIAQSQPVKTPQNL